MKLSKITLSNIRRFKENVSIDVSKGATILLAPNGTGKTSIFEAIELALTGQIKRLGNPPTPVIRHNVNQAKIRLDFDTRRGCEVEFTKKQEVRIIEDYPELFEKTTKENLPFLLRLTHVLDQSSRDWFVQKNADGAAEQLDRMAIGQDATIANSKIIGLKRTFTSNIDKLQLQHDIAKRDLDEWNNLLNERNTLRSELPVKIENKQDLIQALFNVQSIEGISADTSLEVLKTTADQLQSKVIREKTQIGGQVIKLKSLATLIKNFTPQNEILQTEIQLLLKIKEDLTKLENDNTSLLVGISELSLAIEKNVKLSKEQNHALDMLLEFEQNEKELRDIIHAQDVVSKQIQGLKEKKAIFSEEITQKREMVISYQKNLEKLRSINNARTLLSQRTETINSWIVIEDRKKIDASKVLEFNNNIETLQSETDRAKSDCDLCENNLKKAEDVFTSSQRTIDGLKAAVLSISMHLPKDATDCPVCRTTFEPHLLHDLIVSNLSNLEISVLPARDVVDNCKRLLDESYKLFNEKKKNLENLIIQRDRIQAQLNSLNNSINQYQNSLSINDLDEAKKLLSESEDQINKDEQAAKTEARKFSAIPSLESLEVIENDSIKNDREIAEVENSSKSLLRRQSSLMARQDLQRQAINIGNRDILAQKIEQLNIELDNLNNQRNILSEEKVGKESNLTMLQDNIAQKTQTIRHLESELNHMKNAWSQENFPGDPDYKILEDAISELNLSMDDFDKKSQTVTNTIEALSNLESMERHLKTEREILTKSNGNTEQMHSESLNKKFHDVEQILQSIKEREQAIDLFSKNLSHEIVAVNKHFKSINPYWQRILQRLIVDPKFITTNLAPYTSRRKNKVELKLPINDENFNVTDIASEAQLTDLQLSLLLSMAQLYQWSPWKALLLDDPTQHHDLVHASAIFDLLRDYISDYGFQIIMATHDSVQANYFLRKLRNDGIEANIYTLKATKSGVEAIVGN